jgi:hypothetical protein
VSPIHSRIVGNRFRIYGVVAVIAGKAYPKAATCGRKTVRKRLSEKDELFANGPFRNHSCGF